MNHMRQTEIYDPEEQVKVTIIGAGSVGSYVAYALAKMGLKSITIYDDDKVEPHNVPVQFFSTKDIGQLKVESIKKHISEFCGVDIKTIPNKATKEDIEKCTGDIIIFAVDNMKARSMMFSALEVNPHLKTMVDVRTAGEQYRIYTIELAMESDIEYYKKSLYKDSEGSRIPCSAQGIIYSIMNMGSEVANTIKKLITGEMIPLMMIVDMKTREMIVKLRD
jgi:molybdopterin/thiamine biosynthesis adenylyltransferase